MALDYKRVRQLRKLLLREISSEVPTITVEHLLLVEQRIHTIINANVDPVSIISELKDVGIE